ncbi:MAG: hypothetical protein ACK4YF_06600 [Exilispira sp.]
MSLTQKGVASISLSVPVRYIHAPWSIIHRQDFENYIKLAVAIVKEAHNFNP